jgi:hypothetical protein
MGAYQQNNRYLNFTGAAGNEIKLKMKSQSPLQSDWLASIYGIYISPQGF